MFFTGSYRNPMSRARTSIREPKTLHFHLMSTQLPSKILFFECYLITCIDSIFRISCVLFCVTFIAFVLVTQCAGHLCIKELLTYLLTLPVSQ